MANHKQFLKRLLLVIGLILTCLLAVSTATLAQSVPQGYQSDQPLQKGMVVRLKPGDGSKVQAATQQDAGDIFGVVVPSSEAAVSLSNTTAAQEIFVSNAGQYEVLVSTQNGNIRTGDYITVSSLSGIGMKATPDQEFVLGKALSEFDGKSKVESTTTLKTSDGDKMVTLGRVTIEIAVAHNPHYQKQEQSGVPRVLANLAQAVTDRPVTAFRIYASLAVVVVCSIIAGSILFAGVRTSMTAVGRNPLAKRTIGRSLLQVTIIALIVFVIGIIAVYLLLRI